MELEVINFNKNEKKRVKKYERSKIVPWRLRGFGDLQGGVEEELKKGFSRNFWA